MCLMFHSLLLLFQLCYIMLMYDNNLLLIPSTVCILVLKIYEIKIYLRCLYYFSYILAWYSHGEDDRCYYAIIPFLYNQDLAIVRRTTDYMARSIISAKISVDNSIKKVTVILYCKYNMHLKDDKFIRLFTKESS